MVVHKGWRDTMKDDLSNQELKDIFGLIGAGILSNSETIDELNESSIKEVKESVNKLEEENKRLNKLMGKVFKLIDWKEV